MNDQKAALKILQIAGLVGIVIFSNLLLAIPPSPVPSVSSQGKQVSEGDSKRLIKEFRQAQKNEMAALTHRQSMELREYDSLYKTRRKEFDKKEKEALHAFRASHKKGPEQRDYVKEFIKRRDAAYKSWKEERACKVRRQNTRKNLLRQEQEQKLKRFEEDARKGKVPSEALWPKAGT